MQSTQRNTYRNTDRQKVLNFVQSLGPTSSEAPYLACILEKSGLSMRDAKTLCDFIASRATERPLERDAVAALGLPSLPRAASPGAAL